MLHRKRWLKLTTTVYIATLVIHHYGLDFSIFVEFTASTSNRICFLSACASKRLMGYLLQHNVTKHFSVSSLPS